MRKISQKALPKARQRTGEKLCRLAYSFEADASRYRGVDDALANELRSLASKIGRLGRSLDRE